MEKATTNLWSRLTGVRIFLDYFVLISMWISVREVKGIGLIRYEDVSFPAKSYILNHTITCGEFIPGKFVAKTYTCAGMRVDGHRLAYGHYHGWSIDRHVTRCMDTNGVHEFGHLCKMLLKSMNAQHLGFKAVYIPNSTCGYINETRKVLRKVSEDKYHWVDFRPGWGYTDTIQCLTEAT